jgi:hypothetical protein
MESNCESIVDLPIVSRNVITSPTDKSGSIRPRIFSTGTASVSTFLR